MWWSRPKAGFESHACGSKRERSQVSFWIEHKHSPYRTSRWWLQTGRSSSPWCCPFQPSALTPAGGGNAEEVREETHGTWWSDIKIQSRCPRFKFATVLYSTLVIHFSLIAMQTTKRSFITLSLNEHKCNLTNLLNDLCSNFLSNGKDSFKKTKKTKSSCL